MQRSVKLTSSSQAHNPPLMTNDEATKRNSESRSPVPSALEFVEPCSFPADGKVPLIFIWERSTPLGTSHKLFLISRKIAADSGSATINMAADNRSLAMTYYSRTVKVEIARQRSKARQCKGLYASDTSSRRRVPPKSDTSYVLLLRHLSIRLRQTGFRR